MELSISKIADCKDELIEILNSHWEEVFDNSPKPIAPDWDLYQQLETAGALLLILAKHQDKIIGYVGYVISHIMADKNTVTGSQEGFFITKEHRGGSVALRMLDFAESELRTRGVNYATSWVIPSRDYSPLLLGLGYEVFEIMYRKKLGG